MAAVCAALAVACTEVSQLAVGSAGIHTHVDWVQSLC